MFRILLSISSLLAACTPSSQKAAMPTPGPETPVQSPDTPAQAMGRRILSTAFVRVGADGHLTVALHDGRELVLRDVVMRPGDYCGTLVAADAAPGKYCGGYAEVAAARPGGAPAPAAPAEPASGPPAPRND